MANTITMTKPSLIMFTDGSVTKDAMGSGGIFQVAGIQEQYACRIDDEATIYDAERIAITEGIHRSQKWFWSKGVLFSDSLSNLQYIAAVRRGRHTKVDNDLINLNNQLKERNRIVYLYWIPSHKNIKGNDIADDIARQATERKEIDIVSAPSISKIKNNNHKTAVRKWANIWDSSLDLSSFHGGAPEGPPDTYINFYHNKLTPTQSKYLTWLRSGFIPLNYMKHKMKKLDSPTCRCGEGPETRDHFLFVCKLWDTQRANHLHKPLANHAHRLDQLLMYEKTRLLILNFVQDTRRFRSKES